MALDNWLSIASPAIVPVSFEPCEVNKMVRIKINGSTISKTKDCKFEPAGIVALKFMLVGNNNFKIADAMNAPMIFETM